MNRGVGQYLVDDDVLNATKINPGENTSSEGAGFGPP
jgi:hypothetical protein